MVHILRIKYQNKEDKRGRRIKAEGEKNVKVKKRRRKKAVFRIQQFFAYPSPTN
jgi:hypothetical protein